MLRKTRWSSTGARVANGLKAGLPEERKALVERYMIGAEEAEVRASRAVEARARHEPDERARRDAEAERGRREAEVLAQSRVAERPRRPTALEREADRRGAASAGQPFAEQAQPAGGGEFPIYEWVQRAVPAPAAAADWPRSLVKRKEEARRAQTPQD